VEGARKTPPAGDKAMRGPTNTEIRQFLGAGLFADPRQRDGRIGIGSAAENPAGRLGLEMTRAVATDFGKARIAGGFESIPRRRLAMRCVAMKSKLARAANMDRARLPATPFGVALFVARAISHQFRRAELSIA